MRLQGGPGVKALCQLALTESCVDFAVANAVNERRVFHGFSALAFRYEMVFVDTAAGHHRAAAQRAMRWLGGRYVT